MTINKIIKIIIRLQNDLKNHPNLTEQDGQYYEKEFNMIIELLSEHCNENSKDGY